MTATISANGFIEIPPLFRASDHVQDGQTCDIERLGRGEYRLRVRVDDQPAHSSSSWLDILFDCPVQDWYEPAAGRQTTDELPASCFA
ncbi:MAG: hypothetical protein JNM65_12830 [Verrucomicrobiaceae bacterium]|nr:hypothetical protein [Verrucomicrobiaceae bacterium]